VQAVDDEARGLLGETDDTPEPSAPFVPRIARLPRDGERPEQGPARPGSRPEREGEADSLTSLLEAVPSFRGDLVVPEQPTPASASASSPSPASSAAPPVEVEAAEEAEDTDAELPADAPPADQRTPAASAGATYADVLMPRSVGGHRERLTGNTDRQAEADGVRPGRRAAVPSWDEIVFGTRRKKKD
jgi:hypothetical protein